MLYRSFLTILLVAAASRAQTPTFNENVAPIIYNSCTTCHRIGQVAPFTLASYDDVRKHALTIVSVTQSHYMPPWKPEPAWVPYRDERRLTSDQISTIQKWVSGGMPEGNPASVTPLPAFPDDWQLGKPDLILELPVGFAVPATGDDIYRNFVIPTNLTQDKYIRAIELKPTARAVVHHSLFFSDNTGGARKLDGADGQAGFPGFGSIFTIGSPLTALSGGLGGWVPGTTPEFLPDGITLPLPAGSDFLMQMHFHPNGIAQTEKTVVGLYFGPAPARELTQLQVPAFFGIRANIDIPAGKSDYMVRDSFVLPVAVEAVSVSAHAHYLAKEAKLTATLPNGDVHVLLWIHQWDFNWQDQYLFKNLVALPAGTRLDGELIYDNSSSNYRNPNSPAKRVKWGENSTDEMGSLLLNVVPQKASDITLLRASSVLYYGKSVPLVGSRPLLVSSGVVDSASALSGPVTPGKIITLYGNALGASGSAVLGSDGKLSSQIAGTEVLFDGIPAPMLYSSSGQLAAVVPYALDGKAGTQIQVRNGFLASDLIAVPVTPIAPSIFSLDYTGTGQGAVINFDDSKVNSATSPAAKGSYISIYATGEGQTSPGGIDGQIANGPVLPKPLKNVQVLIDGRLAEVQYAGAAPGAAAGLLQVNARIPEGTASGTVSLQIIVGDVASQPGLTIAVR